MAIDCIVTGIHIYSGFFQSPGQPTQPQWQVSVANPAAAVIGTFFGINIKQARSLQPVTIHFEGAGQQGALVNLKAVDPISAVDLTALNNILGGQIFVPAQSQFVASAVSGTINVVRFFKDNFNLAFTVEFDNVSN